MGRLIRFFLLLFGLSVCCACHHMAYVTVPGELVNESTLPYREVGSFEIEVNESYWLWGLAKSSDETIARAIVEKVREMGGNGVRDLHYKVQLTLTDICCSCVGGLVSYSRQTVIVAGTVVQITGSNAALSSMQDLDAVAAGRKSLQLATRFE